MVVAAPLFGAKVTVNNSTDDPINFSVFSNNRYSVPWTLYSNKSVTFNSVLYNIYRIKWCTVGKKQDVCFIAPLSIGRLSTDNKFIIKGSPGSYSFNEKDFTGEVISYKKDDWLSID